jgi:predicted SprT family Zn-dependent metalloprotease
MNKNNHIGLALEELYRIFDKLNKHYYRGGLPYPMLTIQATTRGKVDGWVTVNKVWKYLPVVEGGEEKYEICICAETLNQGVVAISAILQHEMVHLFHLFSDIKDHSNNRHNKKFKMKAEEVDLSCTFDERWGWGYTGPTDKFVAFIENSVKPSLECFTYFREIVVAEKAASTREKKTFKYTCPECSVEARAKRDVNLMCGNCEVHLEMEEDE